MLALPVRYWRQLAERRRRGAASQGSASASSICPGSRQQLIVNKQCLHHRPLSLLDEQVAAAAASCGEARRRSGFSVFAVDLPLRRPVSTSTWWLNFALFDRCWDHTRIGFAVLDAGLAPYSRGRNSWMIC